MKKEQKMQHYLLFLLCITFYIVQVFSYKLYPDDIDHSGDSDLEKLLDIVEEESTKQTIQDDTILKLFSKHYQKVKHTQTNRKTNLNDDIIDFIDLIPAVEVKAKLDEYYRNDIDVQHIFEYFNSKEFLEFRKHILDLDDVVDILNYLNANGLNIKTLLKNVDDRLDISKMKPYLNDNNKHWGM